MSRATAQSNTQRHWPQKHIAIAAPALYIDMSRAVAHTSESALDATHEQTLTETVDLLPAFTWAARDTEGPPRGALYSRHGQGYAGPVAHTSVPLSTLTGSLRRFMHMQPDSAAKSPVRLPREAAAPL